MTGSIHRYGGWFALALGGLFIVSAMVYAPLDGAPAQKPTLWDRDSESWLDDTLHQLPGGGIDLTTHTLVMKAGTTIQRFNPTVLAERRGPALRNVRLYIQFRGNVVVQPSKAWLAQGGSVYSADLGNINPGERRNTYEALFFVAPKPQRLEIAYIITAQELRPPIEGRFTVEVR